MNKQMLLKLKNNPHYKLSEKQKKELMELEKGPMIEFGVAPTHDNSFSKHTVTQTRKQRSSRKVINENSEEQT